jgi:ribosomal protein S27AE
MIRTKHALCPACEQTVLFYANGQQRWPQAVADAHGLPAVIDLWTCPNCGTTRSDPDLIPLPEAPRPSDLVSVPACR